MEKERIENIKRIIIGSDHAGFELKQKLITYLRAKNLEIEDAGTGSQEPVDYPDFAKAVALRVKEDKCYRGIVICGTGIGASITANKIPGIRAALCTTEYQAKFSRLHNDANILALGARITGDTLAYSIVEEWLFNDFEGGRHIKRLEKIKALEKEF